MLPPSVRIFVCTVPQDMRRSFDALAQATAQLLGEDPRSGALFVFVNKRSTRAKVLWWDANGYCLLYKRLHPGRVHRTVDRRRRVARRADLPSWPVRRVLELAPALWQRTAEEAEVQRRLDIDIFRRVTLSPTSVAA
jgi:transposase